MAVTGTECYRENLAALRAFQPDVADRIERTRVPPGIQPAEGRDGTETFLVRGDSGRRVWLGCSSMPGVSAEALFAGFQSDGRSVALPGILTGVEPLVIVDRMPGHAALFIVEPDPVALKLVLQVRDYAGLVQAGRLVFILGDPDETRARLCSFFDEHTGYELPVHLLSAPSIPAAQAAGVQRAIEQAAESVTAVRARLLQRTARAISARTLRPLLDAAPRVALLGYDPSPTSIEQAGRIQRALSSLGWPHRLCVPDRPDQVHQMARVRAVEAVDPDFVLFVNSLPGSMRTLLPESLPIVSWMLPGTVLPGAESDRTQAPWGPTDAVFASSRSLRDQLLEAGLPAEAVVPLAAGAEEPSLDRAARRDEGARVDVALLADLPDDRPEASGIVLHSHQLLWRALARRVERDPGRGRGRAAGALLDLAQRDSGTHLQDAEMRRQFLELLATRLAPAAMARTSMELLLAEGYRVAVWGANWRVAEDVRGRWRGPVPAGRALGDVLEGARIVLFPIPSAGAVQAALDALAGDACVVCNQPDEQLGTEYPGLADLAPYIPTYRTAGELLDAVRTLLPPRGPGAEPDLDPCAEARDLVRRNHMVKDRLVALVDMLRRRQATVRGSAAVL